jgi:hypothetical protein
MARKETLSVKAANWGVLVDERNDLGLCRAWLTAGILHGDRWIQEFFERKLSAKELITSVTGIVERCRKYQLEPNAPSFKVVDGILRYEIHYRRLTGSPYREDGTLHCDHMFRVANRGLCTLLASLGLSYQVHRMKGHNPTDGD